MADNHDRHFLDLMTKEARVFELALEEAIAQFDYSNDPKWRQEFKEMMIKHAKGKCENGSE